MIVRPHLQDYRRFALAIARDFYLPGADRCDVEQEAMIALWVALRDYDPAQGQPFKTFAGFVIRRRLVTALKRATLERHLILTQAAREIADEDVSVSASEAIPGGRDPADVVLERERLREIVAAVRALTEVEQESLALVLSGVPYQGEKRVDNGVQRARRKLRAALA